MNDVPRRRVRLFGYLIIASALMSFVPAMNAGTVIFAATLALVFLDWILTGRIARPDRRTMAAGAFVAYSCLSYFILEANGYSFTEWSRAIVPFLFFILLFLLPQLTQAERAWLSRAIFLASMVWLIRIFGEALFLAFGGSDVFYVRLTWRVIDSVLPFPLVAIPYLLFVEGDLKAHVRYSLLFVLLIVYLWIGYRAGLALIGIPFLLFAWSKVRRRSVVPLFVLLFGALLAYYFITHGAFSLGDRFAAIDLEGTSSRTLEWRYAIAQWRDAPLLGKGLGWQVPGYITFAGVDDPDIAKADRVGYVHSSLAYMGMNLGLVGIFLYYAVIMPRRYNWRDDKYFKFSSIALLLLLAFCLTQASFRTIQTILLTLALVRINVRPAQPRARARRLI